MDERLIAADEAVRLDFVRRLPLDEAGDVFELVVDLARQLLDAEVAYVALMVDTERVWHSPIGDKPAGYAVRKVTESSDAAKRPAAVWHADMPNGDVGSLREVLPNLRFYANTPIYLSSGVAIGALCVAGERPHPHDDALAEGLQRLAALAGREAERVTALKELSLARDDAQTANQAKSEFLAAMSHEIRTPMNGVLGMAQAMAADTLSPVQRERLDVIWQSGEMLLALINDILDLSKIEAGRLELEEVAFDIDSLAPAVRASFAELAARKGVDFDLTIETSALGAYWGDPTRLRQIIYNLVSNAMKFTEAGAVRVCIDRQDDELRIKVSDTGVGIAPERHAAVFERFSQAETSTTRRFGGTGLGLAIVHELVSLMDGRIELDSALGEGAVFTAVLPLRRAEAAAAPAATDLEILPFEGSSLRVLAAEDNDINRRVLKAVLQQAEIEVEFAVDGLEAVQAWRDRDFDLILMDVHMPRMDGPAATREIRAGEAESGRRPTPIIALTANVMAHQLVEYRLAGMDWHVGKPIDVADLLRTMEAALARTGGADDTAVETASAG